MEVSCKIGGMDLDPLQLTMWRFLISGVVLLPVGIGTMIRQKIRLSARDVLELMWIGTIVVPLCNGLFQFAVKYANASTVSILVCVNPFFTMVLARLILKEKLKPIKMIALGIALCGILLMLRLWDVQEGNSVLGMICVLLSSAFFGLYAVISQKSVRKLGMTVQTSLSFVFGSLILMAVLLITGRPVFANVTENIPILLYVGLVVTGLGYFAYLKANELAGATTAAYAFFFKPMFAPILAMILLHERILWNTVAGAILILAASLLNILYSKARESWQRRHNIEMQIRKQRR